MNWDMVNSMIERSLSNLYRRMNVQAQDGWADLIDPDTLVAAAAGSVAGDRRDEVAARRSRSPVQTDLVRLLHELAADAAIVAEAVNVRAPLAHGRGGRRLRHGADKARRHAGSIRWAGLAACLVLVAGFVFWQPHDGQLTDEGMTAAARPDRIFTSQDRIFAAADAPAPMDIGDGLFRSDFNGG